MVCDPTFTQDDDGPSEGKDTKSLKRHGTERQWRGYRKVAVEDGHAIDVGHRFQVLRGEGVAAIEVD
jgi:hypothetical protein